MRRVRSIFGLLAGVALSAPAVGMAASDGFASGFYTRGVDAAAYMDQGDAVVDPFYVPAKTGALLPRVSLAVAHEDNVFLDPEDGQEGTTATLAPGLLALWGRPVGNHVYADYGASLPIYQSEEDLDDEPSHLLRLGAVYRKPKSQLSGQFGFRRLEDLDTAVGARIAKRDLFADLNAEHRISGKTSLGALGRAERHEFESEGYVEYDRYYGAGRAYYRATPKSEVFAQGGLGRDEPRKSIHSSSAADFCDLSLGVRGKQSPKFNSSGRVGYMWRTYDDGAREGYEHWIASLKAESRPFGLTTFGAEVYADVRPAVDADGFDAVDQGVVGRVSRRLFIERLRGNAAVTLGQIDYSGGDGTAVAEDNAVYDGRSDDYWGFTLGVDWWARKHFSVGLAYSYAERDGSQDAGSEAQEATSYEYGRWTLRASWNY